MSGKDIVECAANGGCTPVKELHDEQTNFPKVSWHSMTWILLVILTIISGIGGLLYAKGEKNQEDIKELAISNTELKVAYKNTEENTKQILEILREQKRDKDAEKIASKELKEYNTVKN
jgi:hypothetical protein